MANKNLFQTLPLIESDTINNAGGQAISMSPEHRLAQYACTGCFNNTYYVDAKTQLAEMLQACAANKLDFVAKCAVYAHEQGKMKDAPAFMLAYLSAAGSIDLFKRVFPKVITNVKQLRTFVQILRSGVVGRKSFGRGIKRCIQCFLQDMPLDRLFYQSVGNNPSLGQVIKMAHPKPKDEVQANLFRYLSRGEYKSPNAELVVSYETYKRTKGILPNVPFQMLDSLGLDTAGWTHVARLASWQTTRMNLNTFLRHGVFESKAMIDLVAARLRNDELIAASRVFPYQLFMAFKAINDDMPPEIGLALQDAMEIAIDNTPTTEGVVAVCPDTSGSMSSPITGSRGSATTKMECVDVAALFTAAILRKNPHAVCMPFDTEVRPVKLNPRDSVMTNASRLALRGGGTDCSAPLRDLNRLGAKVSAVIIISDFESWLGQHHYSTSSEAEWDILKRRCPGVKYIGINIRPQGTTQTKDRPNILNVGGFSDSVFDIVSEFIAGKYDAGYWVKKINEVSL